MRSAFNVSRFYLDIPLLFGLFIICTISMIVLYSASDESWQMMQRHILRFAFGFAILLLFSSISLQNWYRWTPYIYTLGLVLLLIVLFAGTYGKGAQRWLNLGFVQFQPSEIMKLAVPMMVAWVLAESHAKPSWKQLIIALLCLFIPVLLIVKQPDLGTSILVACSGLVVIFMAGVSWRIIFSFLVALIIFSVPFWFYGMKEYQRQRILTLLEPESDPLGSGYHIIQSKIAIGSGGVFGKGWLNGTQSHLEFLPERHTDFIFAVFAEEFGLLGCFLLISLYAMIVLRGFTLARNAPNTFARLLAMSITSTFLVYIFVNIGMVSGILPVVGVPLPLVSYGGTSILTLMAGFGLLMAICCQRNLVAR